MPNQKIHRWLQQGIQFHKTGNLELAEDRYQRILYDNPDSPDALHLLGLVEHQKKRLDKAAELIARAINLDASQPMFHNNLGNVYLDKELPQKAIRCYQQAIRLKPDYVEAFHNLGNALTAQGEFEKAIACYQRTLNFQPTDAQTYLIIGRLYKSTRQFNTALHYFLKAVELNPVFPDVLFDLGYVYGELGNPDKAIEFYRRVLDIKPESSETLYNLAALLAKQNRLEDAIECVKKTIAINPNHADAYNDLALYFQRVGKKDKAIEAFREAIRLAPQTASYHLNLSLVLLQCGRFEEGWEKYDYRFEVHEDQSDYRYLGCKIWDGRPFADKCLLVHDDQGVGDTLQFIRYLPLVKKLGGTVIADIRKEVLPLLGQFEGIDTLMERPEVGTLNVKFDCYIPLLSIPGRLQTNLDSIPADVPYLYADSKKSVVWNKEMSNSKINIGIVWAGNKMHVNDSNRSCSIGHFSWLQNIPQISTFSLQKEISPEEEQLMTQYGFSDLRFGLNDFSDTAAIVDNLDLVITVDTAVAHLAGAMGKPTWILVPFDPDWRWLLERSDSPWYPTVRLFRQNRPKDWDGVMCEVRNNLMSYVNALQGKKKAVAVRNR